MRDEKLHPHVARSTSPSQNVQNTPTPEHFWKLRCRKSARRCGTKNMSKSKCTKHFSFAALFRHLNFKKWSERCAFSFFTCKCAPRQTGVQLFISHLARWLRARRFSEPRYFSTLRSHKSLEKKHKECRDFPTFSRTCIFFLLTLSLL